MAPNTIMIMRHAEKSGDPMDPHLTPAGHQRAAQLATWLPTICPQIDFIFATAQSPHSNRPIETVEPLSAAIGVPINKNFADQDYGALAHELLYKNRYNGKTIVISWHHGNIPPLANALNAVDGEYPNPWPRKIFNLVLRLAFDQGENQPPTTTPIIEPF